MSRDRSQAADSALAADSAPLPIVAARAVLGGVLMGLANLVPGISGGTMLLAAGIYPAFISGIAELTTLRFRLRNVVAVGTVAVSAGLAILLLAGLMKSLVVEQRWVMYSLFIGLTLGGVPLVWRLARPATSGVWVGAAAAFAVMLAMQLGGDGTGASDRSTPLLLLSGLAGASAMILPGVSGGYLLLLLGQYETILGAIDQLKQALLGSGGLDMAPLTEAMGVVVPVGIGVVIGIVGVSNAIKWLLEHHAKPTLGALLGLLFGAVVGLWPFQEPVSPQVGDVIEGRPITELTLAEVELEDWPVQRFDPTAGQVGTALGLAALGLVGTLALARMGGESDESEAGSAR